MNSTIELTVRNKDIHIRKSDKITTGQQLNKIDIFFDGDSWIKTEKKENGDIEIIEALKVDVVFRIDNRFYRVTNEEEKPMDIPKDKHLIIDIPPNVGAGINLGKVVFIGIRGTKEVADTYQIVYPTPYFRLGVIEKGATPVDTLRPEEATQTAYDKAVEKANVAAKAAEQSEINAAKSEANAAKSEANAAKSEANAAKSETKAAKSETNAAESATAARDSETKAAKSEANAAESAAAARDSEINAAKSETNAANSEANAANSAAAAARSASDAQSASEKYPDIDVHGHWIRWNGTDWVDTGALAKFTIFRTYSTIEAMYEDWDKIHNDYYNNFVLIASEPKKNPGEGGSIEDDNGKLFIILQEQKKDGNDYEKHGFSCVGDLSGAQGIQGPKGPKGDKGEKGEQGPVGPAGTYTAGTGIKIENDTISATAEVYTAGDGISITNSSISARLGLGLKFDDDKKIALNETAFTEYTDGEITSIYNSVTI